MQCKTQYKLNLQIDILDKARGKRQHYAGGLSLLGISFPKTIFQQDMGRISRSVKVFVSFFDKLNLRVKKQTFKHFEQILLTVTLIIFYVTSIKWFFCLEDAIPGCLLFRKNYIFSMPCTL